MNRFVALTALTALLAGCATGDGGDDATATSTAPTETASVPAQARPLLAEYDLDGKNTVGIIDHLDRLRVAERPTDLMASVRPSELVITSGSQEFALDIPDRFYLSVAPYVNQTHECFHHSLTTCKGELSAEQVRVKIVDETNDTVLVDETVAMFDNGFVGFWLPREIEGTLEVGYGDKTGRTTISTDAEAPTCLTTLRLA